MKRTPLALYLKCLVVAGDLFITRCFVGNIGCYRLPIFTKNRKKTCGPTDNPTWRAGNKPPMGYSSFTESMANFLTSWNMIKPIENVPQTPLFGTWNYTYVPFFGQETCVKKHKNQCVNCLAPVTHPVLSIQKQTLWTNQCWHGGFCFTKNVFFFHPLVEPQLSPVESFSQISRETKRRFFWLQKMQT